MSTTYRTGLRRILLLLSATAIAAFGLTACSSNDAGPSTESREANAPSSVTYVTATALGATFAPELIAINDGLLGDDLTMSVESANGSAQALQLVIAGTADFTAVGPTDFVSAIQGGAEGLVSFGIRKAEVPFHLVTSSDFEVTSPEDLIGKTIGLASVGGTTEQLLDLYLISGGVDPSLVPRQAVGFTAAAYENVKSGQIAGVILNNAATSSVEAAEDVNVLHFQDVVPMAGTVYVARAADVEAHPDTYAAIIKAFSEGAEKMLANAPEFTATIAALQAQGVADVSTAKAVLAGEVGDYSSPVDLSSDEGVWTTTVGTLTDGRFGNGEIPPASELYTVLAQR